MSDSEDEFASADEGEVNTAKTAESKPEKSEDTKQESDIKPKPVKKDDPVKATPEEKAGKGKKGGAGKQSGAASKSQASTSSADSKGKQMGKKGKQKEKGGKKGGKEPSEKAKPKAAESTDNVKSTEDISAESDKKSASDKISEDTDSASKKEKPAVAECPGDEKESENNRKDDNTPENSDISTKLDEASGKTDKDSNSGAGNTESECKIPTKSQQEDRETVKDPVDKSDLVKSPSTQSIPRPGPDHTQDQENVLNKLADAAQEPKQSSWGWGGWGSSLLTVASSSVSTFTNQVGEGFNTMLETVESTLNVPSPEDLVKKTNESETPESSKEGATAKTPKEETGEKDNPSEDTQEEDKPKKEDEKPSGAESQTPEDSSNSWFSSWGVGNITKMVESTGKTLVTGSLDVLETLGKKTMDALNEHDPGLKKTRGMLRERGDKPNLSETLRMARDQHEEQVKLEKESEEARKVHFGTLFDEFQGLAHLEALEILSNQSEKKVNSLLTALSPEVMSALKPQLLEVKDNFELDEEDEEDVEDQDFSKLVTDIYTQLNIGTSPDKLTRTEGQIRDLLTNFSERSEAEKASAKEIHQAAIQSLAEFTSKCIEQFHKSGEMVLLQKAQNTDFVSGSKHLHSLTKVLCTEVGILSTKFTETLNSHSGDDDSTNINQLVTSVYLEASNSSSYIQDGFQLLLPVIQQAAIEKSQEPAS